MPYRRTHHPYHVVGYRQSHVPYSEETSNSLIQCFATKNTTKNPQLLYFVWLKGEIGTFNFELVDFRGYPSYFHFNSISVLVNACYDRRTAKHSGSYVLPRTKSMAGFTPRRSRLPPWCFSWFMRHSEQRPRYSPV